MKIQRHLRVIGAIRAVKRELYEAEVNGFSQLDKDKIYERLITLYSCLDLDGLERDITGMIERRAA